MARILIVEDDEEIAMLEKDYLEINNYETMILSSGDQVIDTINKNTFDLILLDVLLPGCNGYEVCKKLRQITDIPILMVSAKTESIDKIRGLGLGADDYVAKPFDPAELVARVKAHIDRYNRLKQEIPGTCYEQATMNIGSITVLPQSWKVYKDGKEIKLPNREFQLLKFLASNPNIVFSKEHLFQEIWGYDYVGDSATVTVHINRIRDKIEDDTKKPQIIETIWGAGYRLNL